jgi:hypothetical protein
MPIRAGQNASNAKRKPQSVSGFLGGLNTFQDETLIKDSELTEARNILLSIDGVQPRPGSLTFGSGDAATRIDGLAGYYKSDGTRELIRMAGGKLQKQTISSLTDIDTSYTSLARTSFIQAMDKLFIFNPEDGESYYDGSTVTRFTAIVTPTGGSVTPQGSSGSTAYSYKLTAFNAAGETLATAALNTSTGNATLSATNFNRIAWTAVAGAVGYNVYGRKAEGLGQTYLDTIYTNQYDDKGQRSPSSTIYIPEANTTGGIEASMAVFGISRIFAAGDPAQPSRLYYSDTATKLGNFNISLDSNAGFVDVFKNDGYKITSIIPFQGGVIVFKENAIYKFDFVQASGDFDGDGVAESVSLPSLSEITRSFGGVSFRSTMYVENDVIFAAKKDGRLAFYSLGNQENYAGSVLRTNELSIKVQEKLEDVNVDYLDFSAGFYYNNIYGCAVAKGGSTHNDRIWCLDTRFGAWTYWEGLSPAEFVVYNGSDGTQRLFYGTDDDGEVIEMFKSDKNDDGRSISVQFATKSFNQDTFYQYKKYKDPVMQFKDVNKSGALSGEIYVDGAILQGGFSVNQQIGGGAGVGFDLPGQLLAGGAGGSTGSTVGLSSDIIIEVKLLAVGRSIKYNFRSNSADLDYKFLSIKHDFTPKPSKMLPQTTRFYATS